MIDKNSLDEMMKNLSDENKKKVNDILNDKEKLNKILNDKSVQALIKKLGGKNG